MPFLIGVSRCSISSSSFYPKIFNLHVFTPIGPGTAVSDALNMKFNAPYSAHDSCMSQPPEISSSASYLTVFFLF